jgi:C-terminal processing protease CtpA/Prc
MFAQERVALEIEAKRVALEAMLDEIERQQSSLDDSMGGADRKELARRKQEQVQRLMLEQKRQRELRIVREAEERRKKAASMPNSLMNAEASAAFVRRISPFEDLEISVPKTQGELRIHVKHSKRKGLFIHGFKPNSLAEQQGLLCAGDELLTVDGVDVRHTALPGLVAVLKGHTADSVRIKLRRHKYSGVEL